jgi:hypothetical protein
MDSIVMLGMMCVMQPVGLTCANVIDDGVGRMANVMSVRVMFFGGWFFLDGWEW